MRWTLRARLGLWHAAAVALILAATGLAADAVLSRLLESQMDAALVALAETEAASALDSPGGVHLHATSGDAGPRALRRMDKLVQIVDAEGRVLDRSPSLREGELPAPPALLARLRNGETVIESVVVRGEAVRLVSLPLEVEGRFQYAIQVGALLRPARALVRTVRLLLLGAAAAVLAAVVLIGAVLTRSALRPIEALVTTARRIGESSLGRRLPHPGTGDEVGRLVDSLNAMLDRLEKSFETQRRFTADASHELRSPLSRLRAELEIALRKGRTREEYEAVLRSALEETERLATLTENLLTLARLDAGEAAGPAEPVALADVVAAAVKRAEPEAARRGVTVTARLAPGVVASAGAADVALVVENLLDNALKFSPPGGRVTVETRAEGGAAVLAVSDTGPGIPPEEVPHVFKRFFRGDSRGPDTPGVGLGLAICRSVVERRGGQIAVESRPGAGATFTVRLPLAA